MKGLCRAGLRSGRVAVFLAILIVGAAAWPQPAPLPAPVADATLPSAPEAHTPVAQAMPGQSLPGSLEGVVVDKDGTVCEGAHVALVQAGGAATAAGSAISGSDGRFVFGDVPAGAFTVTVSSEGFTTQTITGVLHSGESYEAQPVRLLVTAAESQVQVTASQQEIGLEQFKEETQQRVLGVIPNFYVSYAPGAPPLSSKQKFHLAWRSSIDPVTFLSTGFFAGIEQAQNDFSGYGQGVEGYAKRYAANYADNFIGTMIGAAILPSLLKQDPRYFYKGTGSKRSRILYAIAMSVVCKGDNGHWQGNYSAITAGFASAEISNLYYPASDRNEVSMTLVNFGLGTAETAFQNLFQEFFLRKLSPKLPNYGSSQP